MIQSHLAFRSALAVSFILAASSFSVQPPDLSPPPITRRPLPVPRATLYDVVSLLSSAEQASTVDPDVAQALRECFRFLVPNFNDLDLETSDLSQQRRRELNSGESSSSPYEYLWQPPLFVWELAAVAGKSRATTARGVGDEVRGYLDANRTTIPVPDVEGSYSSQCDAISGNAKKCSYCNNKDLEGYLTFLFHLIADRAASVDLNVTLNRFDLFHGHFIMVRNTRRLGILFHTLEYPICGGNFPCSQTKQNCEKGTNVVYDEGCMNKRNILWLAPIPPAVPGVLVSLDARPDGIIYRDFVRDPKYTRTIDEDPASLLVDVNYVNVGGQARPDYKIIIC